MSANPILEAIEHQRESLWQEYQTRLAKLNELEVLARELDDAPLPEPVTPKRRRGRPRGSGSSPIPPAVLSVVPEGRCVTPKEIRVKLRSEHDIGVQSAYLSNVLKRLVEGGQLERPEKGMYRKVAPA